MLADHVSPSTHVHSDLSLAPSLKSLGLHEYRSSLMQAESESLLFFSHWHHDNVVVSAGWAGSPDNTLSDLDLYMTLPGASQEDPLSPSRAFSLVECPMLTPSDTSLPSYLPGSPPSTQVESPAPSSQPQTHHSSSMPNLSEPSPAHERIVHLLLSRGANVNIQNADGQTPLHIAAQQGHLGIVRLLLSSKFINVNVQDRRGATPLHLASENGHVVVVELLVAHNARLDVKTTSI